MRPRNAQGIAIVAALLAAGVASAQEPPADPGNLPTAEERRALREQRREEYANMSEEERAQAREQRALQRADRAQAARERFENMSEEERQALRENRMSGEGTRRPQRNGGRAGPGGRRPGPAGPGGRRGGIGVQPGQAPAGA